VPRPLRGQRPKAIAAYPTKSYSARKRSRIGSA
jgi:hypothetical protein